MIIHSIICCFEVWDLVFYAIIWNHFVCFFVDVRTGWNITCNNYRFKPFDYFFLASNFVKYNDTRINNKFTLWIVVNFPHYLKSIKQSCSSSVLRILNFQFWGRSFAPIKIALGEWCSGRDGGWRTEIKHGNSNQNRLLMNLYF